MKRNEIEITKKPKSLNYIDAETGNYVQYECILKGNEADLHDFYNSLHRMKLDSSAMPKKVLKEGKTTTDLVNEFKGILSSEVISFDKIVNLFDHSNLNDKRMIQAPVVKFLDLFDLKKKGEYTEKELGSIVRATKEPAFRNCSSIHKTIKELHSIATNTKLLNYKQIAQKQVKNKVYSK